MFADDDQTPGDQTMSQFKLKFSNHILRLQVSKMCAQSHLKSKFEKSPSRGESEK